MEIFNLNCPGADYKDYFIENIQIIVRIEKKE